eukprot:Pompholyxophrys_punicea_v1_NODE_941_length_1113_cov_2.523629.p1 type:complete len:223 gc:universal NODE_941_length_1113_cov_2.523629:775-107(-)
MKFLFLLWKADHRNTKYAIQAWFFLALSNVLLSEADAFEMLWNRTVNRNCEGLGKGIHKDLNREFDNRPQKDQIAFLHRNHDPELARRVSRAMMGIHAILENFDRISNITAPPNFHKNAKMSNDVEFLVQILLKAEIFTETPSRCHPSFPNFDRNLYKQDVAHLRQWMQSRQKLTVKRGKFCHTLKNSKKVLSHDEVGEEADDDDDETMPRFYWQLYDYITI